MDFTFEFRPKGHITFGDMRKAQKGDLDACANVICASAYDQVAGQYADPAAVLEILDGMMYEEVAELVEQVARAMLPKAN